MATQLTAQEAKLAKAAAEARANFVQDGLLPSVAALRANNPKEAMRLQAEKVRPLSASLEQSLDALMQAADSTRPMPQYEAAVAAAGRDAPGVDAGHRPGRAAGRRLRLPDDRVPSAASSAPSRREAAALAQRVAAGDLDTPIALRAGDSSSLMAQLKAMQAQPERGGRPRAPERRQRGHRHRRRSRRATAT